MRLLACLALLVPLVVQASEADDETAALRRRGMEALADLLPYVDADDPHVRVRSRNLVKQIVMDHLRANTPAGMRLVPGPLVVSRSGVSMEKGLYLAIHEVTLGEFRRFVKLRRWDAARWSQGGAMNPVASVSLKEARAYAKWRGARIPTVAELEWAATGGGRFLYPWGDKFSPVRVNSREAGLGQPEPVGSRRRGLSVHGLADLCGNVAEWTETATGRPRARRFRAVGGSFRRAARSSRFVTYTLAAEARLDDLGFRLAKSLPPLPVPAPRGS
ncbi:MAG: formylglycine-generating enzyme family protein [Planctomycetota bacterium]|jgi:hypothetical protein